jgi:hypothetical protein
MGKTVFTCVFIEKIFFSRTSRPISIKLSTSNPWVKEFDIVQIKGQILCKREIIAKMGKGYLKIFLLKNH